MKEEELLPCPFCGNNAISVEEDNIGCNIVCYKCGIGFVEDNWTKEYVFRTWNMRTDSALRARVKELEESLIKIVNTDRLEHGILYLQDVAEKALNG